MQNVSAEWDQGTRRQNETSSVAHNPKVEGSNPAPATKKIRGLQQECLFHSTQERKNSLFC